MLLVIDNYDSFTYNLVQMLAQYLPVEVRRNDQVDLAGVRAMAPRAIVISPGPGRPEDAGISIPLLREFSASVPVLGVCLGLQALGAAFGANVVRAPRLMHGKTSRVYHDGTGLFRGLPNPFEAMRYHSLVVEEASLPAELKVSAYTSEGEIMGLTHSGGMASAVQFHPESILTEQGGQLIANFVAMHKLAATEVAA